MLTLSTRSCQKLARVRQRRSHHPCTTLLSYVSILSLSFARWRQRYTIEMDHQTFKSPAAHPTTAIIGIVAQSTLRGQHHLLENICIKKLTKCRNFTCYLPKELTKFPNFIFSPEFWGASAPPPPSPTPMSAISN